MSTDNAELRVAHVLSMDAVLNVGLDVGQVRAISEIVEIFSVNCALKPCKNLNITLSMFCLAVLIRS